MGAARPHLRALQIRGGGVVNALLYPDISRDIFRSALDRICYRRTSLWNVDELQGTDCRGIRVRVDDGLLLVPPTVRI